MKAAPNKYGFLVSDTFMRMKRFGNMHITTSAGCIVLCDKHNTEVNGVLIALNI